MAFFCCKNEGNKVVETPKNYSEIDQLLWLTGGWTNIGTESQSYETWKQINDSTLSAYSYTTVNQDTVFAEQMTIQQKLNSTILTVVSEDENDNVPVHFTRIPSDKGVVVFENKKHDFPKRIYYANKVKDSLHAWIEGSIDGETRRIDFGFVRAH